MTQFSPVKTNEQRKQLLVLAIPMPGTTKTLLCQLLEADEGDVREFVRLNIPELLRAYDMLALSKPVQQQDSTEGHAPRTSVPGRTRRGRQQHSYAAHATPPDVDESVELLIRVMRGLHNFPPGQRPFEQLPLDEQARISDQVERFMETRAD